MIEDLLQRVIEPLGAISHSGALRGAVGVGLFLAALALLAQAPAGLRRHRLFWLAELILLPPALALAMALFEEAFAALGAPAPGGMADGTSVALLLGGAYLMDRAVRLFLWQGLLRERTARVPAILKTVVSAVIYVGAVYLIIAVVYGQPLTGLIVSSGVLLGVIGLALQPVLGDVIAGVSLTIDRPFKVGDWIELEDGVVGQVLGTDWRATRVLTFANTVHVVPNGRLSNASVLNFDEPNEAYGFWFEVPVTKTVPPDLVIQLLTEAALRADGVLDDPKPLVRLWDVQDRPISYLVYAHCRHYVDHFAARSEILREAWALFGKAGFNFSTRSLEASIRRGTETEARAPEAEDALAEVALLRPLTAAERETLATSGLEREVAADQVIVAQGDEGDSAFVILSGMARVSLRFEGDGAASPETEVARLGSFDMFGEMSLLTGATRSASVTAHTRCRLIEIPKVALEPILAARPDLADDLGRLMAERKLRNDAMTAGKLTRSAGEILAEYTEAFARAIREFFQLRPTAKRRVRKAAGGTGAGGDAGNA